MNKISYLQANKEECLIEIHEYHESILINDVLQQAFEYILP